VGVGVGLYRSQVLVCVCHDSIMDSILLDNSGCQRCITVCHVRCMSLCGGCMCLTVGVYHGVDCGLVGSIAVDDVILETLRGLGKG